MCRKIWTIFAWTFYILSWIISLSTVCSFWLNYGIYNSPIYELDTNYLRWTSTIPAMSVCQAGAFNRSSIDVTNEELNAFLHGIARPNRSVCKECKNLNFRDEQYRSNYSVLVTKMVATCKSLFKQCSWNGKPLDCCEVFDELWTEKGVCYSINSIMTYRKRRTFVVSHFTKRAHLNIAVNFPIQTLVDHSASNLADEQRGCIMAGERSVTGFSTYSESACKSECIARHQVNTCGCRHHLLPQQENVKSCDFDGLQCLEKIFNSPEKVKTYNLMEHLDCNCLPECEGTEIKVVWAKISNSSQSEVGVNIQMLSPPTERIVLKAKVEFMDVLVGFACFTRLFTCSNFLSVAKRLLNCLYNYKLIMSSKLDLQNVSGNHMEQFY